MKIRVESRELRVESGARKPRLRSQSVSLNPQPSTLSPQPSRRGFTLIELLIVITILGILAGLVLGVASIAAQTGRDARTRNIVGRIHTLLLEHYNSYANRRVELNPAIVIAINMNTSWSAQQRAVVTQAARLYALREMMLMEMPDRWSDVWLQPIPATLTPMAIRPAYIDVDPSERTPLAQNYLRRFRSLYGRTNSITGAANTRDDIVANQSAECLYMIVTVACGDGEARTMFHENDIGDVDGDGAQEFLDGWGHPISFFRWAPGFNSQIQGNANLLTQPPPTVPDPMRNWDQAAAADHDPYDLFRVDFKAYRLVPLVYSAGRDEVAGIDPIVEEVPWRPRMVVLPRTDALYPYFNFPIDPYRRTTATSIPPTYFGTVAEGATDNIHNHAVGRRLAVQR